MKYPLTFLKRKFDHLVSLFLMKHEVPVNIPLMKFEHLVSILNFLMKHEVQVNIPLNET